MNGTALETKLIQRMRRSKWAIFVSGTGSNLSALLETRDRIDIALVVSSRNDALALVRARRAGVATLILPKKIDWPALLDELNRREITHIFLAGFMRIVPAEFLEDFSGKVFNIHPSILPSYPGLNSLERAYEDRAELGCTVHEVVPEVDAGPIRLQAKVVRSQSLSRTELSLHIAEHRLVRKAVEL